MNFSVMKHRLYGYAVENSLRLRTCNKLFSQKKLTATSKVCLSYNQALDGLEDGMTVLFGGFGPCGAPMSLINAIKERKTKSLTSVSIDAGQEDYSVGVLLKSGQINKMHVAYVGGFKSFSKMFQSGAIEVNLTPMGTLMEKIRSGGAGIPAFYTPTGYGTIAQLGNFPIKMNADGSIAKLSQPKSIREFNNRQYLLEESITGDFAIIKGYKADTSGNVIFHATARNSNPDCAKAAKICVVEVEEIVESGDIPPDHVHLPGIYVHRIIKSEKYEKRIEHPMYSDESHHHHSHAKHGLSSRDKIAKRAAQELNSNNNKSFIHVNLGIGLPTLIPNYINNPNVVLQSENGLLGVGSYPKKGQEDADLINAGKETVSYIPGSATFSSSESFAMIRGKHMDVTILGGLEVSQFGDFASWIVPGQSVKGMGGAMDLVSACPKIILTLGHCDKHGKSKIKTACDLPLTAKGVVDMIITEIAVFTVNRDYEKLGLQNPLTLIEIAENTSMEEVKSKTEAKFNVAKDLKIMKL